MSEDDADGFSDSGEGDYGEDDEHNTRSRNPSSNPPDYPIF